MECLLPYLSMVTVPHIMVGLERMLDYRGVGLERFHCNCESMGRLYVCITQETQEKGSRNPYFLTEVPAISAHTWLI